MDSPIQRSADVTQCPSSFQFQIKVLSNPIRSSPSFLSCFPMARPSNPLPPPSPLKTHKVKQDRLPSGFGLTLGRSLRKACSNHRSQPRNARNHKRNNSHRIVPSTDICGTVAVPHRVSAAVSRSLARSRDELDLRLGADRCFDALLRLLRNSASEQASKRPPV